MKTLRFSFVLIALVLVVGQHAARAQNYNTDARRIAMGGVGDSSNIAASMVDPAQPYTVIPVPLGLIQVLGDFDLFNPTGDDFDPVRAIELGSSPLHYTFGRSSGGDNPEQRFINDLVNARVNRDLSTYRGFRLPETLSAEGLASPGYGKTIKFAEQTSGAFHGVYIGAGPYLSFSSTLGVDPRLTDILASEEPKYYRNSTMQILNDSAVQLAMSIIFGYRGRFALSGDVTPRDGLYLAANYRYLRGFRYYEPDTMLRFDTDAQGLITLNPATDPLTITNLESSSGTGRAVDVGMQLVRNRWEVGVGINGIANQIDWTDLTLTRYSLTSLFQGSDFNDQTLPQSATGVTVKLPVVTSGNVGFDNGEWAFSADAVHGFNGNSFHGGVERRFGMFAVRGGARYSRERWDPTYGIGFGRKVAVDLAVFGTHTNLQDKRYTALALSIRINQTP